MKRGVFLLLFLFTFTCYAQQPEPTKIKELAQKLDQKSAGGALFAT
jgi:hypothetical protein